MATRGEETIVRAPEPIYYKGWVIQPSFYGFFVSDRSEHNKDTSLRFENLNKAFRYIDKKARGKL